MVSVLGKPGSLQRDGNVAEQRHIEIPPEVFRLDGTGGMKLDSGRKD